MPISPVPADVSSVLGAMEKRLTRLESLPPGAMTELAHVSTPFNTNTNWNYIATWSWLPETLTPAFTLIRPTPILLVTSMLAFLNGGTATFALVNAVVTASNAYVVGGMPPGTDAITGRPMIATTGVIAPNVSGMQYVSVTHFVAPPGVWYAAQQYEMVGGAVTTFTDNSGETTVYTLAG